MGRGFARDYGMALASRGWYVSGLASLAVVIATFILTDVVPALAVALAILLVASVLVAHGYYERLAAAILDLSVEVTRGLRVVESKDEDVGWVLIVESVRITNRSSANKVSLGIRLIVEMRGGHIVIGEEEGRLVKPEPKPPPLQTPLGIAPQEAKSGPLTFLLTPMFTQLPFGVEIRETIEGTSRVPTTFRLEIEDHVSGRTVGLPVPGKYPADG
jgi:hypothetical protein